MRVALSLSSDQAATAAEAREAEAHGFDAITSGEHLFFHGPTRNAFISLAAAAGATSTIRLLSSLTILPVYPTAVAIKLATTLDQVSGGRFDLGVGVGGEYPAEFDAVGVELDSRGTRTDETLDLARRLWAGEPVTHAGLSGDFRELTLQPGPIQSGGPPVWIGGRRGAAIRRAGRFGDVWLPYMFSPEQFERSLAAVREEAERVGRDPAEVRGAIFCWGAVDEDGARARRELVRGVSEVYQQDFEPLADRYLLHGTPEQVAERAIEYRDAGADTLVFSAVNAPRRSEIVELFATEVLPRLRGGDPP